MTLSTPLDRAGTFEAKLITKHQRLFPDFDDKIISMYARHERGAFEHRGLKKKGRSKWKGRRYFGQR